MCNETTEPVVGMYDVYPRTILEMIDDRVAELLDDVGKIFLGQIERSGWQMHNSVTRLDLHDLGQTSPRGPCVGGAINSGLGKRRHQLAHIHIHAATIAAARLGQGRGVKRKYSHSLHDESKPYRLGRYSVTSVIDRRNSRTR